MKNKIIKIALLVAASTGSTHIATAAAESHSPRDPQLIDGSISIQVNTPNGKSWQAFRFLSRGDYAYLSAVANEDGLIIDPTTVNSSITFVSDFVVKILDKNNNLINFNVISSGSKLRDLAIWLANTKLKSGDFGVQISTKSSDPVFKFKGKIANYKNLVLEGVPKHVAEQYAFVPSPAKDGTSLYARFLKQDAIDTSKGYVIKLKISPDKFLNFNDQSNIIASVLTDEIWLERSWRLVYDQARFAYKITPVEDTWASYGIFANYPVNNSLVLSPQPIDRPTETLGEFWHFQKTTPGEYRIIPMSNSIAASNGLQVNPDQTNIRVLPSANVDSQIFYLQQNPAMKF